MPRVFVALLALVVILAGVLLYVATSTPKRTVTAPLATPAAEAAPTPRAAEPVSVSVAAAEPTVAERATSATEPARREAALTTHEEELARAQWIEGRVLFPEGTPLDEELWITADGRDFEDESDHRVKVERDGATSGAFRVAFSEKSRSGRIRMEGRFLYLPSAVRWKTETPQPVVLEPALGGRIVVRALAPQGTDPAQAGGRVVLYVEERDGNSTWHQERGAETLDPELTAAFDALRPGNGYALSYDGSVFFGTGAEVEVVAGMASSLEIALRPGVVLAGSMRDENGTPLAEANVTATSHGGADFWGPDRHRSIETKADGLFQLGALAPGDLRLQAELNGYETTVVQLGKLEEGTSRADLELVLTRGGSISGIVTWPEGTPAEAQLELSPRFGAAGWDERMRQVNGKSDASGRFRITGLSAESYLVRARATKTEEVTVTSEITGRERKKKQRTQWTAELERVKPGADDLELRLSTGFALSGRVLDERGVALSDFHVSATRIQEMGMFHSLYGAPSKSYSAADGTFVLEGFAPGAWQIVAMAAGHARSERVRVTIPASEPVELRVPREARISGVVLDAGGTPRAGVTVSAVQPDEEEEPNFIGIADDEGSRTDETGIFHLEGLRPGPAVLTATGPTSAPSEPQALQLVAGQEIGNVVLRLRTGATLLGEVVGSDGLPEAEVQVHLHSSDSDYNDSRTTDAAGRFEAKALPPGEIQVFAENHDGLMLERSVTLREGETARVRLAPPQGALVRLRGRVRAGGEPLADASVQASHVDRERNQEQDGPLTTSSSAQSDTEGAYELTLPGSGRYEMWLSWGNFGSLSWSTMLDVPEVTEFVFDVAIPLGRISGRVTDAAGAALAGIWVQAEPERHEGEAHGGARTQTDEEGRYELALPAGTHAVSAGADMGWGPDEAGKYAAGRVSALVVSENGHVRGIDFVLSTGGTLAGSVRAPDGTPVRWVQIWSSDAERVRNIGWCQDSGSFHIGGLEPGTHWICATSQDNRATRAATRVEVEAGKTTRVELELVPATLVRVRVRDAAGAQVGCEIEVLDGEARRQPMHSGGEPGEALVGPLGAGRYMLRARREEKLVELAFEVSATQPNLELELAFE